MASVRIARRQVEAGKKRDLAGSVWREGLINQKDDGREALKRCAHGAGSRP